MGEVAPGGEGKPVADNLSTNHCLTVGVFQKTSLGLDVYLVCGLRFTLFRVSIAFIQ